ncbi:hypothetical protein [Martelella sp. FOR1707]
MNEIAMSSLVAMTAVGLALERIEVRHAVEADLKAALVIERAARADHRIFRDPGLIQRLKDSIGSLISTIYETLRSVLQIHRIERWKLR